MESLSQQHCLNHALREAVARCPECKHFYCRECVTEHEDRVVCASCLKKVTLAASGKKYSLAGLARVSLCAFGFLTAWLFFYWIGDALLSASTQFHDGTVWKTGFWEE